MRIPTSPKPVPFDPDMHQCPRLTSRILSSVSETPSFGLKPGRPFATYDVVKLRLDQEHMAELQAIALET
jgi:hypothetical protein